MKRLALGRIAPGERKQFVVPVENRGDKALIIHSIRSTCGCIAEDEELKDVAIEPGELKEFRFAVVPTPNMRGMIRQIIGFRTNGREGNHMVSVLLVVKPEYKIAVLPDRVDFGRIAVRLDGTITKAVSIVSPYPRELRIRSIESTSSHIVAADIGAGEYPYIRRIRVGLLSSVPPGRISERFMVDTSEGMITIPVVALNDAGLEGEPPAVVFDPVKSEGSVTATVSLRSLDGTPFEILDFKCPTPGIRLASVRPIESASEHSAIVELVPSRGVTGAGSCDMSFVTDRYGTRNITCHFFVWGAQAAEKLTD